MASHPSVLASVWRPAPHLLSRFSSSAVGRPPTKTAAAGLGRGSPAEILQSPMEQQEAAAQQCSGLSSVMSSQLSESRVLSFVRGVEGTGAGALRDYCQVLADTSAPILLQSCCCPSALQSPCHHSMPPDLWLAAVTHLEALHCQFTGWCQYNRLQGHHPVQATPQDVCHKSLLHCC